MSKDLNSNNRTLANKAAISATISVSLLDQSILTVERIAGNTFTIYQYYGDSRRNQPIGSEISIQGVLNKIHELFSENKQYASSIVVTTYATVGRDMVLRHRGSGIRT